jgi:hypothetical protein
MQNEFVSFNRQRQGAAVLGGGYFEFSDGRCLYFLDLAWNLVKESSRIVCLYSDSLKKDFCIFWN